MNDPYLVVQGSFDVVGVVTGALMVIGMKY